jgi:predicted MFS family arabinose efflux permease
MTFILTIPLFQILGSSWRITLAIPGVFSLGALILWQKYYQEKARPYVQGEEKLDRNILKEIIGNKQVRLLTIADTCDMWSFQFVTTYLATFFYTEAMIPLGKSSYLMSIFPIAGIIAGITCGIAMGRIGLRKPFTWPLHIMIFVGTTMALYMTGTGRMIGIFLSGFGNAGWAPALFTMPMEFENMTPEKVGAVYTLMLSAGFFAAFLSPFLGGYLTEFMSLRTVIFLFSMPSLLAAWATWKMKETGSANRTKGNRIMN